MRTDKLIADHAPGGELRDLGDCPQISASRFQATRLWYSVCSPAALRYAVVAITKVLRHRRWH
jgi:hypothetical protein